VGEGRGGASGLKYGGKLQSFDDSNGAAVLNKKKVRAWSKSTNTYGPIGLSVSFKGGEKSSQLSN